ncbi:ATP binding [Rhizoctonia solani]|uniref:ATP binding n=1 Tax=Rhizoctonia solani TaxID=456999 RepID=A0A8H7M6T7_9AGAM|nr:ATP binding [Rhizoctonia solani]
MRYMNTQYVASAHIYLSLIYLDFSAAPLLSYTRYNVLYSDDYTKPLFELLSARSGERIADLGCGTGELTLLLQQLVGKDGVVVGVDASESMLAKAKENGLVNLFLCDVQNLVVPDEFKSLVGTFDGKRSSQYFSRPAWGGANCEDSSKAWGRFVGALPGYMNAVGLRCVAAHLLERRGKKISDPWFLPQPAEYAKLLESEGFIVEHISLNPRVAVLPGSLVDAIRSTIRIAYLKDLEDDEAEEVIQEMSRISMNKTTQNVAQDWKPALYNQAVDVVYSDDYTKPLFDLLCAQPNERIVDLGCGTGELTLRLQRLVGKEGIVVGVDASENMLAKAKENGLVNYFLGDIQKLEVPDKFKPLVGTFDGGRFVGEFCGYMNAVGLRSVTAHILERRGRKLSEPCFLPHSAEYASDLEDEEAGEVIQAISRISFTPPSIFITASVPDSSLTAMSIDATPKPFRGPWEGDTKIVIGIDIGTTQSGVAFAFLQNGASQVIHRVTRWPGQEARDQQGKIPTLVWYDRSRKATAFGAEAQLPIIEEQAEDNGWVLAKYFKLHLHPSDMQAKHELKLDELPPGVTLRQIYSDFLGYLLKHTRSFFEDRILDGKQIWSRYSPTMEVVIAHPNGWGIREQAFLRSAAVAAGFATTDQAPTKVRFVTEAEASVHFCIHHTNLVRFLRCVVPDLIVLPQLSAGRIQPGTNFAVCDAGGSTVDTTLYSVTSMRPILKLKEERASACVQAGAIFVDSEVEKHLRKTLANAGLSSEDVVEYTKAGVKDFEGFAKRAFRDETTEQSVAVAHTRFNNTTIRARRGRMSFPGLIIKEFFDVCVKEITASVDQQINGLNVPYILLVGGFGDSVYVRNEFKKRYESRGSKITLTNDSSSKAVADGALIWSTISSVHSRAPRYSFGIKILVLSFPTFTLDREGSHTRMLTVKKWCQADGLK